MITKVRLLIIMLACGACGTLFQIFRQHAATVATVRQKFDKEGSPDQATTERSNPSAMLSPARSATIETEPGRFSAVELGKTNTLFRAHGNFTERLRQFNEAIDSVRSSILAKHNLSALRLPVYSKYVRINNDDYVDRVESNRQVTTVVLPYQRAAIAGKRVQTNLHLQTYYHWIGNQRLCQWMDKKHKYPQLYWRIFRRMHCPNKVSLAMSPTSLKYVHLKDNQGARFHDNFYTLPPASLIHMHVLTGVGYVDGYGHISVGNTRLIFDYCYRFHDTRALTQQRMMSARYVDEVFVIRHGPGGAVYHGTIEEIPRLAPYVEFLRGCPKVRIHVTDKLRRRVGEFLRVLRIDPSRLIWGPIRAGIVYVPRAPTCMFPRVVETQLLSHYCQDFALSRYGRRPRNRLVLVLRTGERRFLDRLTVQKITQKAAADFGLVYTEYLDDPPPSFGRTMAMFYEAVLVVAAHGAGLSNIVFCRPGTFVVEVVPNNYVTPMCYLQLAHGLGHHWHGIGVKRKGTDVVRVDVTELRAVVRRYLTLNRKQSSLNNTITAP